MTLQHSFSRLGAALTAAAGTFLLLCAPLNAAAQNSILCGDCNQDGNIDSADAGLLSAHLTTETPLSVNAAAFADMNSDGILNAQDLTLLKRAALHSAQPTPTGSSLIERPTDALSPSMPAAGTIHALMIVLDFPDCKHTKSLTAEQLKERCFGAENPSDPYYPLESISAFYQRASYGRFTLEGEVVTYSSPQNLSEYTGKKNLLLEDTLSALDAQIDYTQFDADHDGCIDALILSLPAAAGKTNWTPSEARYTGKKTFDGMTVRNRCIGCAETSDRAQLNSIWTHELGHTMGLPDYYKYTNTEKGYYGLNGEAGWELMDDRYGDLSAFSKLMCGWYAESEVHVYTGGTQTFKLYSSQAVPNCVVIPRGELNGFHSEYFVLEYAEPCENNFCYFYNGRVYNLFKEGGVRVLHCEASLCEGQWGTEFKYGNHGKYYDTSNEKQRVVRLVNEAEGGAFFRAGDSVTGSISGFHWYDDDGGQTVETGLTITVERISDGICQVTVSE